MSIFYPPAVFGGGLSAVYTSGSITGSGLTGNEIRLKDDITVVSVTASYVSSSEFHLSGPQLNGNPKTSISSPTGIADVVTGSVRAARYTAMVETTTGDYHVQSADLLLANNGSTALITPYAVTCTSGSYLALFDAQINGSNVEIVVNKLVSSDLAVTMTKTYLS